MVRPLPEAPAPGSCEDKAAAITAVYHRSKLEEVPFKEYYLTYCLPLPASQCTGSLYTQFPSACSAPQSLIVSAASPRARKSPRSRPRESPLCAWRSRIPAWGGRSLGDSLAADNAKFWSDEKYNSFYNECSQERYTLMVSTCDAGLAPAAAARRADTWRRHGVPAPSTSPRHRAAVAVGDSQLGVEELGGRPGELSDRRVAHFQQVFAELSGGKQVIESYQAGDLLRSLGVPDAKGALEQHLPQASHSQSLSYHETFSLYEQVISPDIAISAIRDALQEFTEEATGGSVASAVHEQVGPSPRACRTGYTPPMQIASGTAPPTNQSPVIGQKSAARTFRDQPFASVYKVQPQASPRSTSLFKKLGKFTVRPNAV